MRLALKTIIVCTQLMPNTFQTICLKPQSAIAMQIVISLLLVGFIWFWVTACSKNKEFSGLNNVTFGGLGC